MYIHRETQIAYLAHPATASQATQTALRFQADFVSWGPHHSRPEGFSLEGWTVVSVVRNHFDALVSWAHKLRNKPGWDAPTGPDDFGLETVRALIDWGGQWVKPHRLWWLHTDASTIVFRMEDGLEGQFNGLLRDHGLGPIEIPRLNESPDRDRDYRRYYDAPARAFVEGCWWDEMRRFDYTF